MPIINRDRKQTDTHYRYKMPAIEVKHEGGGQYTKTLITNLKKVAEALNTSAEIINHFLAVELGTKSSSSSDHSEARLFLRGTHKAANLQDQLDKYINIYVKCGECNIPEGHLQIRGKKKSKTVWTYCPSCGHNQDVTNVHKTSNFIKNNWVPPDDYEKFDSDEESKKPKETKKESKKDKRNNLKLKVEKEDEDVEWTINELDEAPNPEFGFQLPGMEMNGFQLPSSSQNFELPTSGLGMNLNLGDEPEELADDEGSPIHPEEDSDLNVPEQIIECSTEDMARDYDTVCQLVQKQGRVRSLMLVELLEPVVRIYKDEPYPRFGAKTLDHITQIADKLELSFKVASVMASILFDQNIISESQIENYRHLLAPFLSDPPSQENLLNCLLRLADREPELIIEFPNVIETLYMNNLLDDYVLLDWYKHLIEDEFITSLKINPELPLNVFQLLSPLVDKIKVEDESTPWSNGISFGYQEIKIMHSMSGSPLSEFSTTFQKISSGPLISELDEFNELEIDGIDKVEIDSVNSDHQSGNEGEDEEEIGEPIEISDTESSE